MIHSLAKAGLGSVLSAALLAAPLATTPAFALVETANQGTSSVIIDEVYLSGGSAGAAYKNKFVELYNTTDADISLDGWSLQYRPPSGVVAPTSVSPLKGKIPAKGTYLVKGGSNGAIGAELPTADADATGFNPGGAGGTIVLAKQSTSVAGLGVGSQIEPDGVADLLGYGTSNTFETKASVAPAGNTDVKSLVRTNHVDTNDNSADFSLSTSITPTPSGSEPTTEPTTTPTTEPTTPVEGVTPIAEIQGTGSKSPLEGKTVTTRGKVTARYASGGMNGYFIQTPGTGGNLTEANHKASDAIFVYSSATAGKVAIGDYVEITGAVSEYFGQTQITVSSESNLKKLTEAAPEVKATPFTLPASDAFKSSLEGMLLAPSGDFTVADNYYLNNFGELTLAAGNDVLPQPNAVAPYGTDENKAVAANNAALSIKLDDGATTNFLTTGKNVPLPYISNADPIRVGSKVTFKTNVVLNYANNSWKFQPLENLTPENAATVQPASFSNTRQDVPQSVGGNLKIASFNVLNYFATTGDKVAGCTFYTDRAGNNITVNKGCDARGAANQENFLRQQAKTVAAINASTADVVTLMEVENSAKFGKDRDWALSTLVDALNAKAGAGTWDYVRSPKVLPDLKDEDVIRTAFIYKKAVAEPVGESIVHIDNVAFSNARKPLAQVFKPVGGTADQEFIAIANHFKSKGSGVGNDTDQGQGASNFARVAQSKSLLEFTKQLETEKKNNKVFLIGDFNAYSKEDPINVLTDAGFVDQDTRAKNADGTQKHSYLFSGLSGSLDHILASPEADKLVNAADIWNINSVESIAMEYSRYNYNVTSLYQPNQFRNSDHDPVIVGLNLAPAVTEGKINILGINDFHGRIDANTVNFAGTIEKLRKAAGEENTLFISAGDNIGASLFASSLAKDQPTIDVLNALGLKASAVGNHEFDGGWDDLKNRVINNGQNAKFSYLGANVYKKGTKEPALPEYATFTVGGLKVAVIGAVTEEVPTLVTPSGIKDLDFGNPVEAVNRVAAKIKADQAADIIVAEYHEGAGDGVKEGATIQQEIAAGGAFADIVTKTTADVNAIFTGHTHKEYAWDGPIPGQPGKTRPIVQTGSYGENIGQIELNVDLNNKTVSSYTTRNVPRTTDKAADLISTFPRVAEIDGIVKAALAKGAEIGNQPVGSITKDITTAFTPAGVDKDGNPTLPARDDRGSESTLGNLVADSLVDSLKDENLGGAEIGVVNPGGLRNELYYAKDPKNDKDADGVVTFSEANAVLPFVNNLWTTSLTGAQFKTMLEQQWQTNPDGTIPSRSYQQLGLSKNVNYTYDATRPAGDRIVGIWVGGQPIDPAKSYRVGTFNFLITGGDNFRVFKEGTGARDSGLVDRDAWMKFLKDNSPVSPDFARRSVAVKSTTTTVPLVRAFALFAAAPVATVPEVSSGDTVDAQISKLNLTSLGSPANTELAASFTDAAGKTTELGTVPVTDGAATASVKVPAGAAAGAGTVTFTAAPSGTVARVAVKVLADTTTPTTPSTPNPTETSPTTSPTDGGTTSPTTSPTDGGTTAPTGGPTTQPTDGATSAPGTTGPGTSAPGTSQPGTAVATSDDSASATAPAKDGELANTGANATLIFAALAGVVILAAGVLLIVAARRRSGSHS